VNGRDTRSVDSGNRSAGDGWAAWALLLASLLLSYTATLETLSTPSDMSSKHSSDWIPYRYICLLVSLHVFGWR